MELKKKWRSLPPMALSGKFCSVFNTTAQVLLINDQLSGVGTILEQSRLQGVLERQRLWRSGAGQDHE